MERIIGQTEIESIQKEVAEAVLLDSISISAVTLKDISKKTEKLKQSLQISLNKYNTDRKSKTKNHQNDNELKEKLKEVYQYIMSVRTFLLGKDQEIQYRIYYRDPSSDLNEVVVYDLSEEQLLEIVYRDKATLRLPGTLSEITRKQFTVNAKATALFNQHFSMISNGFTHPGRSKSNYIVGKDIIKEFGLTGRYYAWQPGESNKKGQSAYTRKLYNRGWIYQAFDATIAKYGSQLEKISSAEFKEEYFTQQLRFDNLKGFKGGDVDLNQIKTNAANLMSATTLINYLNQINKLILDMIASPDINNTRNQIKNLFLDPSKNIDDKLNIYIDSQIDKLIKLI